MKDPETETIRGTQGVSIIPIENTEIGTKVKVSHIGSKGIITKIDEIDLIIDLEIEMIITKAEVGVLNTIMIASAKSEKTVIKLKSEMPKMTSDPSVKAPMKNSVRNSMNVKKKRKMERSF